MRYSILLIAAALVAFRIGPAEAVSLKLNDGLDDRARAESQGFGHWIALEGEAVLVGSRDAARQPPGGFSIDRAFMFSIRDGTLLRRFDEPVIAPRHHATPGVLVDSYEVLIGPDEKGAAPAPTMQVGMGSGMLTWTAHRAMPEAVNARRAVAIDNARILIGAPLGGSDDAPAAQVSLYSTETGNLLRTFTPPGHSTPNLRSSGDDNGFGRSVAISGDLVLIGAPGDDTNGRNVGGAYLYSASSGALLHRFEDPTVTGADRFGTSVAVSGTTVAVGAPGDDSTGDGSGQAYLFHAADYTLAHVLRDPEERSRLVSRVFGQGSQYHSLGRSGGGVGGGGGTGGGGGGGSSGGSIDDGDIPTLILDQRPGSPQDELPETLVPAPLPGGLALYAGALGLAALLFRRRRPA